MIKHILLDFDHCLAKYRCDGKVLSQDILKIYSLLMNNRFSKITFEQTNKEDNGTLTELNVVLRYIVSYYRPNEKVLDVIKSFRTIWKHDIKLSIASDSPINMISQFIDLYDLEEELPISHYFTWETMEWRKKNDADFYFQIRNILNIKFDEMILIDDSSENIELFKTLGGQILFIPSTENYRI